MNITSNQNAFKTAGFVPVKKIKDGIVLKSDKGVILSYTDGNYEGFIKKNSSKTNFNEGKVSSMVSFLTLIGMLITYFTTDITIIRGASMSPTYSNNEIIVRSRTARDVEKILISKNAIIRFNSPSGDTCLKRIMGVPGDTIEYEYKIVRVNGKSIDTNNSAHLNSLRALTPGEPTAGFTKRVREKVTFKLKPNQYFVMGDNKQESEDSRTYGPIEKTNILSVVQK